jgi:hypothetical protein
LRHEGRLAVRSPYSAGPGQAGDAHAISQQLKRRSPFGLAQGRLSTRFGAGNAPSFAQDDSLFLLRTLETGC